MVVMVVMDVMANPFVAVPDTVRFGLGTALGAAERVERTRGIEPLFKAWEALVLPLNYAREARAGPPENL